MRGDRSRGKRGGVKGLEDRELLKMLRKVKSIPVKVYGENGETVCFEVQVGVAGVLVPGTENMKGCGRKDKEEGAWESG